MNVVTVEAVVDPTDTLLGEIDRILMRAYGFTSRRSQVERCLRVEGGGWLVLREHGRVVATAGYLAYPTGGYGWIGLVATDPDAQRRGYARVVTQAAIDRLNELGCACALDASARGAPVYEAMGFTEHGHSRLFTAPSGVVDRADGPADLRVDSMNSAAPADLVAYDTLAWGADRGSLLRCLFTTYPGRHAVVRRGERIVGYGIAQADAIGPVVADDAVVARLVIAELRTLPWAEPPRLIVPPESRYAGVIESMGFALQRALRRQHLGIDTLPGRRELLCAQSSFGEG
jgi:GNAT superfamily N-acetyltransferase